MGLCDVRKIAVNPKILIDSAAPIRVIFQNWSQLHFFSQALFILIVCTMPTQQKKKWTCSNSMFQKMLSQSALEQLGSDPTLITQPITCLWHFSSHPCMPQLFCIVNNHWSYYLTSSITTHYNRHLPFSSS